MSLGTNKMTKTLDERMEELCDQKGLRFKPWELPPWIVGDGPCPQNCSQSDRQYWAPAKKLRRELINELNAERRRRA
jgi:hypothetical protein